MTLQSAANIPYDDIFRCRKYIEAALAAGLSPPTHVFMDIVEGIEQGKFQFWPGKRSVLITEIITYAQRKGVHAFLAGGDLQEIMGTHQMIRDFAKTVGADHFSITGRPGWSRVMRTLGENPKVLSLTMWEI